MIISVQLSDMHITQEANGVVLAEVFTVFLYTRTVGKEDNTSKRVTTSFV